MNRRFFKNLLCLFTAVTLAAAAQEVMPALWTGAKVPWLIGVATYYAVRREAWHGFAAALWCGVVQDGLDGTGTELNAPLFVCFWAFCVLVVKRQMSDGVPTCAAAAVVFALTREFACFAAFKCTDFAAAATAGRLLARLSVLAPVSALAAALVAVLAARADSALGNVWEERGDKTF